MDSIPSSGALQAERSGRVSRGVVRGRQRERPAGEAGEERVLTNFRLPKRLLDELDEVRSAQGKATLVEIVREALEGYVVKHQDLVRAVKREREKRLKGSAESSR
jgi:predicted DNA-binding protein